MLFGKKMLKAFGSEYAFRPGWARLQRFYISLFGIVDLPTRIRARAVLYELNGIPCDSFLDVGAGTGVYSLFLTSQLSVKGLALDIDADRIIAIDHQAHQLGRTGLKVLCANENALHDLPSSAFSVVLAIEILQYFADVNTALVDLMQRLRPGGVLIACIPIRDALLPFEHNLFDDTKVERMFLEAGFESGLKSAAPLVLLLSL